MRVRVLGNAAFRPRFRIRRAYLHAIRHAQRYILIENAYFIPDAGVRRALASAVKRGVVVAVAVARQSDVRVVAYASRSLYGTLLDSGVRLFEWQRGMLHAKTAVIDDAWSVVGSYNFDQRSLMHQLEAVAVIADPKFAGAVSRRMVHGLAGSEPVDPTAHGRRGLQARRAWSGSATRFATGWSPSRR